MASDEQTENHRGGRVRQDGPQRLATAVEVSPSKRAREMFAKLIPNRTGPVLQDPIQGQKCSPLLCCWSEHPK